MSPRRLRRIAAVSLSCLLTLACGPLGATPSSSRTAAAADSTRYPIVLHHGFLGFDQIFSVDYFYKVRATLEADGYSVFTTKVPSVNTIEVRTNALAAQIDQILAETGAEKVSIIAHSMGGLDARDLIARLGYGDRVAALITVGTPHEGTPVADVARSLETDGAELHAALAKLFGVSDEDSARPAAILGPVDLDGALWNLSEEYVQGTFAAAHPDDPRVVYESWEGHSTLTGIGAAAAVEALLWAPYGYLAAARGANDGLVPVASARHGIDRGGFPADHVNEIGQPLGAVDHEFRYLDFYAGIAKDLAARGL